MKPETKLIKKQELYKEMDKWLEGHNNIFPKSYICEKGKRLKQNEMTEEQIYGVKLARRWETYFKEDLLMFAEYMNAEIDDIPEQYRRIIMALKLEEVKLSKKEDKNQIKIQRREKRKITRAITWFRENRGKAPKIQKSPIKTPEAQKEDAAYRTLRAPFFREIQERYENVQLEEIPEEYREYMELFREIPKKVSIFSTIGDWLDSHNGNMPKSTVRKDGRRLSRAEMSKEELEEVRLHQKWITSKERDVLKEYIGVPTQDIPLKYRGHIEKLRKYGYGVKEENCFEEMIEWLENHQDKLPRFPEGVRTAKNNKYEFELRKRWEKSEEKLVLEQYIGRPIEDVPEEFRGKVEALRECGLGLTQKDIEEKIFEWLEKNGGILPRQDIRKNGTVKGRTTLSIEEYREIRLRKEWNKSEIKRTLEKYAGIPLDKVPEEFRRKILILRGYGLEREEIEHGDIFEEVTSWLKSHNGIFPRTCIMEDDKKTVKKSKDMTKEERFELSIAHRWFRSEIRKKFIEYAETSLEDIPEEFREKIKTLRESVSNEPKRKSDKKTSYFDEFVTWLDEHNNKLPRTKIYNKGKRIRDEFLTPEQLYEVKLYRKWERSEERRVLNEYAEKPLEDIPEEFRGKIAVLREHGILGKKKDISISDRMRITISRQVGNNDAVRKELESDLILEQPKTEEIEEHNFAE